jgi:hypothetical protein
VTALLTRRRVAIACIVAALAGQVVLPFLHAIVHGLEAAAETRAHAGAWRVEPTGAARHDAHPSRHAPGHGHAHGHEHEHEHEHLPGRPAGAPRPHHHHPGDERGGHGTHAPEHLTVTLVPAPPVVVPPSDQRVARVHTDHEVESIALPPVPSRDHNRGPPVVT